MQIRQFQVAHDATQDRLVLRVATQANEEIRAFITRRFLRELWPVLMTILFEHLGEKPLMPAGETPEVKEPAGSFNEPFRADNPTYPLGSNPLLVSEIKLEPLAPDNVRLTLREGRERSFNLNLNGELMHALCSMLRATSDQAKWELTLAYPAEHAGSPLGVAGDSELPPPVRPDKSRLH